MSELLRILADDVDDETLQAAANAAFAVLEAGGVDVDEIQRISSANRTESDDVEGVAPVLHEAAADVGQRAIDDALRGEPALELIVSPVHGDARRQRIRPNPDPGAPYLLEEARWTGCAWRHAGTEDLERVEIDGDVWHAADGVEHYRGP